MSCVFGVTRMCLANEITYLKAIFKACDLNDDKSIEFDELKIFFKRIEKVSEKTSLKLLKENFELYQSIAVMRCSSRMSRMKCI